MSPDPLDPSPAPLAASPEAAGGAPLAGEPGAPPAPARVPHRRSGRLDLEARAALRRSSGLPPPGVPAVTIALRVDPELVALVDLVAEALGLSRSDAIRRLVLRGAEAALRRADGEADRGGRRRSRHCRREGSRGGDREAADAPWRGARQSARGPGATAAAVVAAARARGRYLEPEVPVNLAAVYPPWHPGAPRGTAR